MKTITLEQVFRPFTPRILHRMNYDGNKEFCSANPRWDLPGVYLWVFDRRYVYVGRAKNLGKRIATHLKFLNGKMAEIGTGTYYKNVATKHRDSSELFILDNGNDLETTAQIEAYWIDFFDCDTSIATMVNMSGATPWTEEISRRMAAGAIRYFSNPMNREAQADNARIQWKDPAFRESNRRRLRKLRDSGWCPSQVQTVRVTTPSDRSYRVRRSVLLELFGGSTSGGAEHLLGKVNSPAMSGWSFADPKKIPGGYARQRILPKIQAEEAAFRVDPEVMWIHSMYLSLGKGAARANPAYVEYAGIKYCAYSKKDARILCRILRAALGIAPKASAVPGPRVYLYENPCTMLLDIQSNTAILVTRTSNFKQLTKDFLAKWSRVLSGGRSKNRYRATDSENQLSLL